MPSKLSICNKALDDLGASAIDDVEDETDELALLCSRRFDFSLEKQLRKLDPNFARKTVTLSQTEIPDGYKDTVFTYAYLLPNDLVTGRKINDWDYDDSQGRWQLGIDEGKNKRLLFTAAESVVLVYTALITNPALFDPLFANAVSADMAEAMQEKVRSSSRLSAQLPAKTERANDESSAADGTEGFDGRILSEWILDQRGDD